MPPPSRKPDDSERLSKEVAEQQLESIRKLRESDAFNHYFLRRLKDKRSQLFHRFYEEDVSPEEREILRRLCREYDIIVGLLDSDDTAAKRTLAMQS